MSSAHHGTKTDSARLLDELSLRILNGERVDLTRIAATHPEIIEQLRELESTVHELAAWGNQQLDLGDAGGVHRVLGDFRILREIGRGGMGIVYLAKQLSLDRDVALKVLPFAALLDERNLRRFQTEARAAAILNHDGIVSVYSVGCERGVHYYAMQWVDGVDLAEVIADLRQADSSRQVISDSLDTRPVAWLSTARSHDRTAFYRHVVEFGIRVGQALGYAHQEGVVHRDIKPANLLLDKHGGIHITDFGLARIRSSHGDITAAGDVLGTLRYMSPEQVSGDQVVDHRSDIYSLGVTLYELLTTKQAFPGEDRQQLTSAVLNDEPIDPQLHEPNLPPDLKTVIGKAMRKDPADRYQSAAALVEDLQRFAKHQPIKARPVARIEKISKFARRNPLLSGLALSTLVLLAMLSFGSVGLAWKFSIDARRQKVLRDREEQGIYARDMRLARIALEEGDLIEAESWLLKWAPGKGVEAKHDFRGFEWYHLWERCSDTTIEHTFSHQLKAGHLSFSPDGQELFDGFLSSNIPIWDLREQPKLWKKLPTRAPNSSNAQTVGDRLLFGDFGGNVSIWDWNTGERLAEINVGSHQIVRSVDMSSEDDLVAIGSESPSGANQVIVWDLAEQDSVFELDVKNGRPSVAFSANGQLIVSNDRSHLIRTFDPVGTNRDALAEYACAGTVSVMARNAHRNQIAICVATLDGVETTQLELLDIESHRLVSTFHCDLGSDACTCLDFHPSGSEITVGTVKGDLHQVTVANSAIRTRRYHFGPVSDVCYASDGLRLASGGWDCQTHVIRCGEETGSGTTPSRTAITRLQKKDVAVGYHIGFLNNSTVGSTEGSRHVHLWNVDDGQIQRTITLEEGPWNTIRIGTDCERQKLAIVRCNWPTKPEVKSELLIWDGQSKSLEAKRYTVPEAAGTVIPFSPSGRFIGVPGKKHTTIVDLVEGRTRTIEFSSWVKSCDFSHDETIIACAPTDGPVRFFDVMSLEEVRAPVEMDHTSTSCIKFAPNSNVLGSTGSDARFRLFDLDENEELAGEQCPRYLSTLSFSPDGRRVATGSMDGRVRIFSTATGDELFSVDVMPWYAYVEFSPDGESLAIASGSDNLVVHAPNQQWVSSLSRTKLDEIICRDVTFHEMKYHERRSRAK